MSEFDWLTSFRNGTTNLADAIAFYLEQSGAPWELRVAYVSAIARYQQGVFSDLAEPLGVSMSKSEKNAMQKLGFIAEVKTIVAEIAAEGFPLNNPDNYPEGTAFHKAGDLLGVSPHYVFKLWHKK